MTSTREPADRPRARARVRAHGDRDDDGRPGRRAPGRQRAARRRHLSERHDGVREAQHLRACRGLGPRPLHPMRQLHLRLPAQRDPLALLRAVGAGRRAGGFPVGSAQRPGLPDSRPTRCRCTSRTAPAATCASRRARSRRAATRYARRSTSLSASRCWPPSERTSRSSRTCRPTIVRESTSAPYAARSSWTPVLPSSPVPAPAAVRRRTSSSCRSSSVTGRPSPTRPAARRSTAATCRPRRGRPTRTDAGRPGRTRCSRTTPSSASACGWPLTAIPSWRADGSPSCAKRWAPSWPTGS